MNAMAKQTNRERSTSINKNSAVSGVYKTSAQNIYRDALIKESFEVVAIIDLCNLLNKEFKTNVFQYESLDNISLEYRNRAIGFLNTIVKNSSFRSGILEIMFGKGVSENSNLSGKQRNIKLLIEDLINHEFRQQVKKGNTVLGTVRQKMIVRIFEKHGIKIGDKQLRSYLSRLEYTTQREHSSDAEYSYKEEKRTYS